MGILSHSSFPLYFCNQEIVPLRKVCRRPETDYRLQQLHAVKDTGAQQHMQRASGDSLTGNTQQGRIPETLQKHQISQSTVSTEAMVPQHGNATVSPGPASSATKLVGVPLASAAATSRSSEQLQGGAQ